MFYKPFSLLESGSIPRRLQKLDHIQSLINTSNWNEARRVSYTLIQDSLLGLHYLHTYDRTFLRIVVTFAYIGWMLYASLYILRPLDKTPVFTSPRSNFAKCVPVVVAGIAWAVFFLQKSPWSYYLYIGFPTYFWSKFLREGGSYLSLQGVTVKTRLVEELRNNWLNLAFAVGALLIIAVNSFFSFSCCL